MNANDELTIRHFANRTNVFVWICTSFFSLTGALIVIFWGAEFIWGMWIPFCFLVIPTLHFLCREIIRLRQRVDELEKHQG